MEQVICKDYMATVIAKVIDENGYLVYAELLGSSGSVKGILRQLGKESGAKAARIGADYIRHYTSPGSSRMETESLGKGQSAGIYAHDSVFEACHIIIGSDEEDLIEAFRVWMREVNTLPYPEGMEPAVYRYLERHHAFMQLESVGIWAVGVKELIGSETSPSPIMVEAIIETAKEQGVLIKDRLRKELVLGAPNFGESDPENARVYAEFELGDGTKYYLVEYNPQSDRFFAFVVKQDGSSAWDEFSYESIFSNRSIVNRKINGMIDIDGNVTIMAA